MGDNSKIQWTEATWNPVVGCDHVSPGCDNCYAAREASGRLAHLPAYAGIAGHGRFTGLVRLLPERLDQPLRWRKPRRVFVNSMSDLFHADIPDEYIAQVWAIMHDAEQHTFQILTKRHARLRSLVGSERFRDLVTGQLAKLRAADQGYANPGLRWPVPNVWLGVSVEDQQRADLRVNALLDTPAVVRWLSCEPLLGSLNLWHWINPSDPCVDCDRCGEEVFPDEIGVGHERINCSDDTCKTCNEGGSCEAWCPGPSEGTLPRRIDWVVAGGESGPRARPMDPDWPRTIRDQCTAARVPFFFKQWGGLTPKSGGRELDGRTWDEYPAAVTVR